MEGRAEEDPKEPDLGYPERAVTFLSIITPYFSYLVGVDKDGRVCYVEDESAVHMVGMTKMDALAAVVGSGFGPVYVREDDELVGSGE